MSICESQFLLYFPYLDACVVFEQLLIFTYSTINGDYRT